MEEEILHKLEAIPGVSSVSIGTKLPMDSEGWHDPILLEGRTYAAGEVPPLRLFKFVSPGFLKTLGTPLVAGREITWTDTYNKIPVAMICESLAREYWGEPANPPPPPPHPPTPHPPPPPPPPPPHPPPHPPTHPPPPP